MLKRIWDELLSGKNLDIYIAIFLAIIAALSNFFAKDFTQGVVLTALSILLLDRIIDKWFFEELSTQLLKPNFSRWEDLKNEFRISLLQAKSVSILGVAPLGVVRENKQSLVDICKRGGKVKILFVDPHPDSQAMNLISKFYPEQRSDANALITEIQRIQGSGLQAKCFDYIPHSIITEVVRADGYKIVFVTLNSLSNHGCNRLSFSLSKFDSEAAYSQEIEEVWKIGKEVVQKT